MKRNAGCKREWSDFCASLEGTSKSQARELEKAVYGMGEFRLSDDFNDLAKKPEKWVKMSAEQRDAHIKRCFGCPLDKVGKSEADLESQVAADYRCNLSISFNECSITTLSRANLRYMWSAASKILDEIQLMEIQSSSTKTRPPNVAAVESIAANALLALSDSNSSPTNYEKFSLKVLK